jgi:hypothetical protein
MSMNRDGEIKQLKKLPNEEGYKDYVLFDVEFTKLLDNVPDHLKADSEFLLKLCNRYRETISVMWSLNYQDARRNEYGTPIDLPPLFEKVYPDDEKDLFDESQRGVETIELLCIACEMRGIQSTPLREGVTFPQEFDSFCHKCKIIDDILDRLDARLKGEIHQAKRTMPLSRNPSLSSNTVNPSKLEKLDLKRKKHKILKGSTTDFLTKKLGKDCDDYLPQHKLKDAEFISQLQFYWHSATVEIYFALDKDEDPSHLPKKFYTRFFFASTGLIQACELRGIPSTPINLFLDACDRMLDHEDHEIKIQRLKKRSRETFETLERLDIKCMMELNSESSATAEQKLTKDDSTGKAKLSPADEKGTGIILTSPNLDGPKPPNHFQYKGKVYDFPPNPWKIFNFMWDKEDVSTSVVIEAVWGHDADVDNNTFKQAVHKLTAKILKYKLPYTFNIKGEYLTKTSY